MYKDIANLRVLHIGNVATNGYNIAKALRERAGIESDVYADHYRYYISQPEWEDADIDGLPDCGLNHSVDWRKVNLNGFKRPDWYFETRNEAIAHLGQLQTKKNLLRILGLNQNDDNGKEYILIWKDILSRNNISEKNILDIIRLAKGEIPINGNQFPTNTEWLNYIQRFFNTHCIPHHNSLYESDFFSKTQSWLQDILQKYDIIQTYGCTGLMYPILHTPSIPRVMFEHGTLREIPFQKTEWGRTSMLAHKTAFANIITNADTIHSAHRIGLTNYTFIPHPVDDSKFCPKRDPVFREKLLRKYGATYLFFAPARQNWGLKGNDRILQAFARFIRTVGRGPKLLLGEWGQEVERSRQLIHELHIEEHTAWIPPLPKRMLAHYINACDAVLDQFILGAFGTTTPEAMACGKPVLLYYNADDHRWCLPEDPPVINVRTAEEIAIGLCKLYENPDYAETLGKKSLAWFKEHHSLDVVVKRHLDIYRSILHAPHSIQVPYTFIFSDPKIKEKHITCVVDCRQATAVDVQRWLEGIDGHSALAILDARLRRIHDKLCCVLVLTGPMPELEHEAKQLGWVICRPPFTLFRLIFTKNMLHILRTDFVYICNLDQPFMIKEEISRWMIHEKSHISAGESFDINPYIPQKIYTRNFIIYLYILKVIFKKHFTHSQCQSIMLRYGINIPAPIVPDEIVKVRLDNIKAIAPHLSPLKFTFEDIKKLSLP